MTGLLSPCNAEAMAGQQSTQTLAMLRTAKAERLGGEDCSSILILLEDCRQKGIIIGNIVNLFRKDKA